MSAVDLGFDVLHLYLGIISKEKLIHFMFAQNVCSCSVVLIIRSHVVTTNAVQKDVKHVSGHVSRVGRIRRLI